MRRTTGNVLQVMQPAMHKKQFNNPHLIDQVGTVTATSRARHCHRKPLQCAGPRIPVQTDGLSEAGLRGNYSGL